MLALTILVLVNLALQVVVAATTHSNETLLEEISQRLDRLEKHADA